MKLKNQQLFCQKNFVNGQFIDYKERISVFNPASNNQIGTVPNLNHDQILTAINQAKSAFEQNKKLTGKERARFLRRWYELIIENQEDLALILTTEQGKPLAEARGEILYSAQFVEWFAEEARRVYGEVISAPKPNQKIIVNRQPVGVAAAITPWNFPSAMITRKAAAAIAAGCSVILKPSELTPFSALALAVLAKEAGIPDGIFNVVTGDAQMIGAEFCQNNQIAKISFTGSTRVGKLLYSQCSNDLKRLSLELGGSAPFIIFADANLDKAVAGLMHAKFRNGGQACTCVNRIFVEEKILDQFLKKFLPEVAKLKVGNGLEAETNIGPMISNAAIAKVKRLISDATAKGAKCEIGGEIYSPSLSRNLQTSSANAATSSLNREEDVYAPSLSRNLQTSSANAATSSLNREEISEHFFAPTVLTGITPDMEIAHEEIFGAVAAIQKFSSTEEVIKMANDTIYGLGSYIYTNDSNRAWQVSEALDFGMVGINECSFATEVAPFGGIKHSGFGREGSFMGIEEFSYAKTLHWNYDEK